MNEQDFVERDPVTPANLSERKQMDQMVEGVPQGVMVASR